MYAAVSVAIVSVVSLVGAATLALSQRVLAGLIFILVSVAAGALFGDAFVHLIPEAFGKAGEGGAAGVSLAIISGFVFFFLLEKFLKWRHSHGLHEESQESAREHDHAPKHLGVIVLVSDSVHNFIDGLIIGISYLAGIEIGMATTVAIVLHEIPQEVGDFGLLLHSGWSRGQALLFNFLTAVLSAGGLALAFFAGLLVEAALPSMLAFAAGGFVYIAGSDLVPELHRTTDAGKSAVQILFMAAGIAVMFLLLSIG